jgi:DNA (cytosine-5)-methyltransferase 1
MAAETYFHNFIERLGDSAAAFEAHASQDVHTQALRGLVVGTVSDVLANEQTLGTFRGHVDLLAGGPPCQGFSHAGKRNPLDPRNELVWEFVRAVDAFRPRLILMENVPGLGHEYVRRGSGSPLDEIVARLSKAGDGYSVIPMLLNAKDHGVPQNRPRRFLVGVARSLRLNVAPLTRVLPVITASEALVDLGDHGYRAELHELPYRSRDWRYAQQMRFSRDWLPPTAVEAVAPGEPSNHELRKHSEIVQLRFRIAHYLRGAGTALESVQHGGAPLPGLLPLPAAWPTGSEIARDGEELAAILAKIHSKKHSQRLIDPDLPAPTVMTIPDDFIHPAAARTLSVREMARLQSFPDLFEFRSKVTTGGTARKTEVPQYTQVGNAVPPRLALAIGNALREVLECPST